MPQSVQVEDYGIVNFPDEMSEADIHSAITKEILPRFKKRAELSTQLEEERGYGDFWRPLARLSQLGEWTAEGFRNAPENIEKAVLNAPVKADKALGLLSADAQEPYQGGPVVRPEDLKYLFELGDKALPIWDQLPEGVQQVRKGIKEGLANIGAGFTTPEYQMLLGAGGAGALGRAGIAAMVPGMVEQVPEQAARLGTATVTGTPADVAREATELAGTGYILSHIGSSPAREAAAQRAAALEAEQIRSTPAEAARLQELFQRQREEQAIAEQRDELARMTRSVRKASRARQAAERMAEEEVVPGDAIVPPVEINVQGSPGIQAVRRVESMPDAEASLLNQKAESYQGVTFTPDDVPALTVARQASHDRMMAATLASAKNPTDTAAADVMKAEMGRNVWLSGAIEIANQKGPNYEAMVAEKSAAPTTEVQNAVRVQSTAEVPVRETPGDSQAVVPQVRVSEESAGARPTEVKAEATPTEAGAAPVITAPATVEKRIFKKSEWEKMPTVQEPAGKTGKIKSDPDGDLWEWARGGKRVEARKVIQPEPQPPTTAAPMIELRKNVAVDLPEFPMARKASPEDIVPAWISYNPLGGQKDFIQVRGRSPLSSYRVPLSSLPEGSWERTKTGLSVDKQAVLNFLNDPVKRRESMSTTGNVKRFHPDDVTQLLETAKPTGRPPTGEGAPLGQVNLEPKDLARVAGAAEPSAPHVDEITRAGFDRLIQINPTLATAMLRARPETLTLQFWDQVRAELGSIPEYADDPRKADALTLSLKNVVESHPEELRQLVWAHSRGGTLVETPLDLVTAQGAVQRLLGGDVPANIRLVSDRNAPLGFVSYQAGELPRITINLAKHATPDALRDTLLEELIHPLQSDPTLRPLFQQIEYRVAEADLARQRSEGYRIDELLPEAANEIVRNLYSQHEQANVFKRAVNQVNLAIKRFFGLNLTDEQVALHLVNQALKNRRASGQGQSFALESPEKVEEYTSPLTHNPEQFKRMAQVLNKELVPPPVQTRFQSLSPGAQAELAKVFPGRIATYLNAAGEVVPGPTFREVMRDQNRSLEERNDYARNGLAEYILYQKDRQDVHERLAKTNRDLETAVTKSIEATPPTNEAELLANNLMGGVLDKIKAEREKTAEGAQTNERIREGIDNIDQLTSLMEQPVALGRAFRGIANEVGRDDLMRARPGEEALQLISEGTGFPGGQFETPRQWIRALANHLDHLTRSDGTKSIMAGRDVIEAALWGLRQLADAREALLEVQMTSDGTLKRFNDEYLNDLRAKVPTGFNTILKKYAKAQVESDALTGAFKRLNKRIDTLTQRKADLEEATTFLNQHDLDPQFRDFGKAVVEYTGARNLQYTHNGPVIEYIHPLTGDPVRIEHTFDKGETVDNIEKIQQLADAGLQYAAQPTADPQKAAFWTDFANHILDYQLVASPDYGRLQDASFNPLTLMTKSKFGLIAETALSRIPGALSLETTRAIEAFAAAMKTKNEFQKDNEANLLAANIAARDSHEGMSLDTWQKEVASPIIDSRQHFGQTPYRAGDQIAGFGHLITREDIKAVKAQYDYEQTLRRLHERANISAVRENPAKIKEGTGERFALSRGPGTVTRIIPRSTRDLPAQWKAALAEEPVEGQITPVDRFLNAQDNFVRVMLGHVMEEERDYFQLGKGPFAKDYKAMRLVRQGLEASGEMPNNLDSLSEWLANHHNDNLGEGERPVAASDVRKALIDEVSRYMAKIGEDTLEKANAAKMDIVSYENGFTQPRGGKIAPGTLYQYGLPDRAAMVSKGNDAVEFYTIRFRDSLENLRQALLKDRERLGKAMEEIYGREGVGPRRKLDKGIEAGNDARLQNFQMTVEEVDRNLARVGALLSNIRDIIKNREGYQGDDFATRAYAPWFGAAVGSVLLRPMTSIVNGASGDVMWMMKMAELRRGGWLTAPPLVIKNNLIQFMNTARLRFTPKDAKERAIKQALDSDPQLTNETAELVTGILREAADREALRRLGVIDSFSTKDYLGWDSERTVGQNIKAAIDTMRNVTTKPDTTALKSLVSYMGIAPRAWQIVTRKIGMRWADNWINTQSTMLANGLAETMRVRAIKAFDARLRNDPVFRQIYEQYGDNFQRFALALTGRGTGELLTPAEITGKWDPRTTEKSAIQLRRTFIRNGESPDLLMLKYWWNKRATGGDRTAPFMTDAQRNALMISMAEDVNLGTLASRPTYFVGNRMRQMLGALSQYWLWASDRLADHFAKPKGQRTLGLRYAPGVIGFLMASAIAGVISNTVGQKANNALLNTVSQKPGFFDATTDEERAKIVVSNAASYWGAMGSIVSALMDRPGKLGYKNPIFMANVLTDFLGVATQGYQSGDYAGPAMNFLAKYNPALQAVINRLPSREGLMEVRNASNALRAATPDTLEAKRRQPSSGSDFRATPMTPLYNAILNAAVQKDWGQVDELWNKAVAQGQQMGIPDPQSAILSAIRTRAPESAVFQRVLTPDEREMVYSRMTPEARAQVESTNAVFDELASRYGRGGATGSLGAALGGRIAGLPKETGMLGSESRIDVAGRFGGGFGGVGVRRGFRTRSLLRRGRRSILRGRRVRSLRTRLPRLRA